MQCGTSYMIYSRWGQTKAVISDTRGRHGPPPLGVHEQALPAAPVTSEVHKEAGSATKHHLLLPPLPSGNTSPHAVPLPNAPGTAYTYLTTVTSQGPASRSSRHHLPMGLCHCQEPRNQVLATSTANCLHILGRMCSTLKIKSKL